MREVGKVRTVIPLLLLLVLAPVRDWRAADVRSRQVSAGRPQKAAVISGPRSLSRQEIFAVIHEELVRRGASAQQELRPEDLTIQSTVPVVRGDMGLQVKRIGFDAIRRETVFELWTAHAPQYLPFEVTTRRDPQSFGMPNPGGVIENAGGRPGGRSPVESGMRLKLPVLARPGQPATLVMLGQNVRVTTTVAPLQPGTKGQWILVRDLTTARVMKAEVVDEGLLQTSF